MSVLQPSRGNGRRKFNISDYLSPTEVAEIQSERSFRGAKGFVDAFKFCLVNSVCQKWLNDISGTGQLPEYDDGTHRIKISRKAENDFDLHVQTLTVGEMGFISPDHGYASRVNYPPLKRRASPS
jgi:hypothetical protein